MLRADGAGVDACGCLAAKGLQIRQRHRQASMEEASH